MTSGPRCLQRRFLKRRQFAPGARAIRCRGFIERRQADALLHIIFLMARKALHPSEAAEPSPPSGNTAPGFCHWPRILAACPYSEGRYPRTQFAHPKNCWTCNFSLRGGKSTTAWQRSSSGALPWRPILCPGSLPSATQTSALLMPKEKPKSIDC